MTTDQTHCRELFPCPFCGERGTFSSEHDPDDFGTFFYICCNSCGARSGTQFVSKGNDCPQTRQEVRDRWNTRAQASAPEGFEPIAWESTTPAYFKYITQSKYEKISDASKQWYKPYRCSDCSCAMNGDMPIAYCDPSDPFNSSAFAWPGSERKPQHTMTLYTRSNAKAGEVEWRLIDTAPRLTKVIVGYYNEFGNWRSVMAMYYPPATLDLADDMDDTEDGFAPEGWYELTETHDYIRETDKPPTHWMPAPNNPPLSTQRGDGSEMETSHE